MCFITFVIFYFQFDPEAYDNPQVCIFVSTATLNKDNLICTFDFVYWQKKDKISFKEMNIFVLQLENQSFKDMEEMCKYIYAKDLTDRLRTRSMLCQIYHQALHDRWYQARDLMLMSHLQDTIQHSDVPTQVIPEWAWSRNGSQDDQNTNYCQ